MEISEENMERLESEFEVWANFLNTGLGLLAFTLALASLGTNSPSINAGLSFIVVFLVRIQGSRHFPAEFQRVKQLAKTDRRYKIWLDGLDKEYFGFKTNFTRYPLFLFGFLFLFCVMLTASIGKLFPFWALYVGI